ncbi:MAG: retropepsin-like aspartic protease [Planctomycetota bacterium]
MDPDAASLVEAVRRAVGAEALFEAREGVTLAGRRLRAGADPDDEGRPIVLSARPNGDFLLASGSGGGALTRGFDGQDAWVATGRGVARTLAFGAREVQLLDGWLRAQLWLVPGAQGLDVELERGTEPGAPPTLRVARPDAHLFARVTIDPATKLPLEYAIERHGAVRRVAFEEWTEEGGVLLPARTAEWYDGELTFEDVYLRRTPGSPPTFAPPASRPEDAEFTGGGAPLPTRQDPGGRYYVRATLNGERPVWLLLDTGFGSSALSARAGAEAGLETIGSARLSGVGGAGRRTFLAAASLRVGPLELADPHFAAIDTAHLSARAGFEVDGILGAPLFERAVVVLDGRAGAVSLFPPGALRAEDVRWSRLLVDGTAPCVAGTVRPGTVSTPPLWFRLDTGSDDTLTVARWAVRRHDLAADRTRLRPTQLAGLFGLVDGWRTKVAALEFGGTTRRGVEVTLLTGEAPGPLADPWIAGNLGTRALVGLRVVLDLARGRVAID